MFAYLIMQRKKEGWGYAADWMPNANFSQIFKVIFTRHIGSSSPIPNSNFNPSFHYTTQNISPESIRIPTINYSDLFFDNYPPVSGNRLRTLTIICTKFPDGLNRVQKLDGYLHHKIFFLTYKNDLRKIPKNSPQRIFKFICVKGGLLFLPLVTNIE